mgnify:FL=1
MLSMCLNLEWLPMIAGFASAVQCKRLLRYTVRNDTKARLIFTFGWSAVSVGTLLWAKTIGSFEPMLVVHGLTISATLVVAGWVWVGQAVVRGLAYEPPGEPT